jgi:hypothetical protein
LHLLPPDTFSANIALLLYTFHQLTIDYPAASARFGAAFNASQGARSVRPLTPAQHKQASDTLTSLSRLTAANATLARTRRVYVCSAPSLDLLFTCALALLLLGVARSIVGGRMCAPDVLGYAASMTYNNPYLAVADRVGASDAQRRAGGAGLLNAMDRAPALAGLRLSDGNVRGQEPVGHVAFTPSTDMRPLMKGRCYA